MTEHMTNRDIQYMFRLYKKNNTAKYVSDNCKWGYATVNKVIKEHHFDKRLTMIQNAALELVDMNQAQILAQDLTELTNIQSMITEQIQSNPDIGFTVSDLEKIMKLRYHLMGMPDTTVEHRDASIEVQRVKRADIIDAEYKTDEPES